MSVERSTLSVESSGPKGAVFLSYAHDDAAAARRIAEALRASGLEVWFDENELRGGDSWDAKIRRQIDDCALFIPVISRHTQERAKGYFRLEWKLAVDQTHLLAAGVPFIAPVVIDDTRENAAVVPPEFMRVQWTRLPGALPTPDFVAQVKRLLTAPKNVGRGFQTPPSTGMAGFGPLRQGFEGQGDPALQKPKQRFPGWAVGALAAVAIGVVVAVIGLRKAEPATSGSDLLATRSSPALSPSNGLPATVPAASAATGKSIAVLPFANLSPDEENAFFADGMHDDLITALAKIRDLKVISRTSVMPYKTGTRNLRKIAEELGVATILEGSVQRAGNRVRLNMQLIDARTDAHLWAETYNKELTDIFTIQAALTQEISTALKASLTNDERALIARRPTQNQAAYDLYLRARILDQNIGINASREETERILALYEQAVALDPAFALAHAQASILNGHMFWFATLDSTPARRARALASLEAAQRLAPGSPEVLLAQGTFEYACNNDWAKALAHLRAAEAGLPNDYQLSYRLTVTHRRLGDMRAALAQAERTAELNPNDARGVYTLIETVGYLRRYQQIVDLVDRHRAITAGDHDMQLLRLESRFQLDGDLAEYRKGWAVLPPRPSDGNALELIYLGAFNFGDLAEADRVLADPRVKSIRGYGGVISEAVSLHRAQIAWLQGRGEDARRLADEAITYYRSREWGSRQQPVVQMEIARAEALAGRKEVALREARAAMAAQRRMDALSLLNMRFEFGRVLVVCDQREEAIALLREFIGGMGRQTPAETRRDPFWSRLKDDPRFEEILRSAQPL